MMMIESSIAKPLPNENVISFKETRWQVKFPNAYREFLKKYNAGIPIQRFFEVGGKTFAIERFLGIIKDYKTHELGWYDIGVVESQIGERLTSNGDLIGMEVVPIAALFAGDMLCLDCAVEDPKPVLVWLHEESGEFDPYFVKVADSFEEFLTMLHE